VPGPFWEYVVFGIALCEAYRVAVGWANPADKGVFTLKDDYAPGDLGYAPVAALILPDQFIETNLPNVC
jgi:hypothetical protein